MGSLLLLASVCQLFAQNAGNYTGTQQDRAIERRAELAAEQMVSLSADKIIGLLQQEPGLLLQVKKRLVREAYEQGRLLDPADLTDEAVFRLVREDENIRVLATQEIEDRYYIRAKPSKEELAQENYRAMQLALLGMSNKEPVVAPSAAGMMQAGQNQEDQYWSRHDEEENVPFILGAPKAAPPGYGPSSSPPNTQQPNNPARQLNQAELSQPLLSQPLSGSSLSSTANPYAWMGNDYGQMPRISPGELPGLLQASASQPSMLGGMGMGGTGMGGAPSQQFAGTMSPDMLSTLLGNRDESISPLTQQMTAPPTQRASLQESNRSIPPLPDPTLDQPVIRHWANPYADVPSLYDLYSQVSPRSPVLERFGADIFRTTVPAISTTLPMDLPVGPDYVLGPGDGLNIELWGSVSQRLQRVVDREGEVALPEAGPVQVSGRTLGGCAAA